MAQGRTFYKGGHGSLTQQFEMWVKKTGPLKVLGKPEYVENSLDQMAKAAVSAFIKNVKFFNVTGNTLMSFHVGVFHKGSLVKYRNVPGEEPTRRTLRKGERYNLEYYYGGVPVPKNDKGKRKPFVGKYGGGGQYGPTIGYTYLTRMHPPLRHTWAICMVLPISYAGYNEKIVATYEETKNTLISMFDAFAINTLFRGMDDTNRADMGGGGEMEIPF